MAFNLTSFFFGLVFTVLVIPLTALLLKLTTKIFKLQDTSYWTAFKIAVILGLVSIFFNTVNSFLFSLSLWISIVGFIVNVSIALFLIKKNYYLTFGKTILVWLVFFIFSLIVGIAIVLFLILLFGLRILLGQV